MAQEQNPEDKDKKSSDKKANTSKSNEKLNEPKFPRKRPIIKSEDWVRESPEEFNKRFKKWRDER